MRFDLLTIFPQYFAALELSLLGKAQQEQLLEVNVQDLRGWAEGKHRAVDDSPAGGGAGMVMMPQVWGAAIDSVLPLSATGRRVLAIPTPSGVPLTQRHLEWLTSADQIVIACGRYEGIDARVADHYRARGDVEVFEFSLGDYVLNGGEVAAIALVEGVGRLLDGVVGNPESLVEESHSSEGLLEYPVYTTPREWRGHRTPEVLFSGDHARIARWRRDAALRKTATRRPDMLQAVIERHQLSDSTILDSNDRAVLAAEGVLVQGDQRAQVRYRRVERNGADEQQWEELLTQMSQLACTLFPLACPPEVTEEEISQFIDENLSVPVFRSLIEQDAAELHIAEVSVDTGEFQPAGYTLLLPDVPADLRGSVKRSLSHLGAEPSLVYLSKLYVDAKWHGTGLASALMEYALAEAVDTWGSVAAVLGTNRQNKRASRFYRRHGFRRAGTRTFNVGGREHHDTVFVRDLTENSGA